MSPVAFSIDPEEQQRQPAQLDVGADAVLAVVEDRAQPQGALDVAPAALDREQLLVGGGQVVGGERVVGGAQQPLAVQAGLALDGGLVDPQQPARGAAQEAAQPGLVLRLPTSSSRRRSVQASEPSMRPSQVGDELVADQLVALGLLGVVADHEPFRPRPAVPGGHPDFLDPQVLGDGAVAALPGQRRGGLGVGVAQLLGVDVVPAAAGQVGPVGGARRTRGRPPTPAGAGSSRPGRP